MQWYVYPITLNINKTIFSYSSNRDFFTAYGNALYRTSKGCCLCETIKDALSAYPHKVLHRTLYQNPMPVDVVVLAVVSSDSLLKLVLYALTRPLLFVLVVTTDPFCAMC